MSTLRGFVFYLALAATIIVLTVLLLATKPFLSLDRRYESICRPWAETVLWLLRVICGIRLETQGMENMPAEGGFVVLSKHQSAMDPFLLTAVLKRPACYLYKKSLHWIPCLGWAIWSMDMLAIDRAKGRSAFQSFIKKRALRAPPARPFSRSRTTRATAGPRTASRRIRASCASRWGP